MKISTKTTVTSLWAMAVLMTGSSIALAQEKNTLKEALKDKFLIGTAVNTLQASGKDKAGAEVIREQFSAIVAENCMKSQEIHPEENRITLRRRMNSLHSVRKTTRRLQGIH